MELDCRLQTSKTTETSLFIIFTKIWLVIPSDCWSDVGWGPHWTFPHIGRCSISLGGISFFIILSIVGQTSVFLIICLALEFLLDWKCFNFNYSEERNTWIQTKSLLCKDFSKIVLASLSISVSIWTVEVARSSFLFSTVLSDWNTTVTFSLTSSSELLTISCLDFLVDLNWNLCDNK